MRAFTAVLLGLCVIAVIAVVVFTILPGGENTGGIAPAGDPVAPVTSTPEVAQSDPSDAESPRVAAEKASPESAADKGASKPVKSTSAGADGPDDPRIEGETGLPKGDSFLAGQVVDTESAPIAGATVRIGHFEDEITAWTDFSEAKENDSTTSDALGHFRIDEVASGLYGVIVEHDRYTMKINSPLHIQAGSDTIVVVMESAAIVRGFVRDLSGAPIADARVSLAEKSDEGSGRRSSRRYFPGMQPDAASRMHDVESVKSGVDGAFEIKAVPPGEWCVTASTDDLAPESAYVTVVAGEIVEGLELLLEPGLTISGRVIDTEGQPIAEASVSAHQRTRTFVDAPSHRSRQVETDADGKFAIPGLEPAEYQINASKRGYVESESKGHPAGAVDIEIVLAAGAQLSGVVLDPQGDRVANAQVSIVRATSGSRSGYDGSHSQSTSTDAIGEFELGDLEAGVVTLHAEMKDYLQSEDQQITIESGAVIEGLELQLRQGVVISGMVQDPSGRALADAAVSAEPIEDKPGFGMSGRMSMSTSGDSSTDDVAKTDSAGAFTIKGLEAGKSYSLGAALEGYVLAAATDDSNNHAAPKNGVILVLEKGGSISGRVLLPDLSPAKGATLQLQDAAAGMWQFGTSNAATSQENGEFKLDSIKAGSFSLTASLNGYRPSEKMKLQIASGEDLVGLEFVLVTGGQIRGRVVTDSGDPIAGASVMAMNQTAMMAGDQDMLNGESESDGTFTLAGASDGTYFMNANKEGFADRSAFAFGWGGGSDKVISAKAGDNVVITLSRGATIAGQVVDPKGAPITSFNVQIMGSQAAMRGFEFPLMDESITATDGRFEIGAVGEGVRSVAITATGFAETRVPVQNFKPNEFNELGVIKLSAGGRVFGTVTDARGTPLADAEVQLFPASASSGMDVSAFQGRGSLEDATDAEGKFEIKAVPAGEHRLVARHTAHANAERKITVDDDGEVGPIHFSLPIGGAIIGKVAGPDGKGRSGITITAFPSAGGMMGMGTDSRNAQTDSQGFYRIAGLTAGAHTVSAQMVSDGPGMSQRMKNVEVPTEGEVTCDFIDSILCRLHGKVRGWDPDEVTAEPGRMGAMIILFAMSGSGVTQTFTQIKDDGNYEFEPMPPGEYQIMVFGSMTIPVTLPELAEFRRDIDMPNGSIRGRVIRGEEPVAGMVQVYGVRRGSGAMVSRLAQTMTGEEGAFSLTRLQDGVYDVYAEVMGEASGRADGLEITGGNQIDGIELIISDGGTLRVKVIGNGGQPVSDAMVYCEDAQGNPVGLSGMMMQEAAEERLLEGIPAGTYRVMAGSPTGGTAWMDGVTITAGVEQRLQIQLPRERGKIRVSVTAGGAPVASAAIEIIDASGRVVPDLGAGMMAIYGGTSTDAEGHYTTGFMSAGAYRLRVRSGQSPATEHPIAFPADGSTQEVAVDL